MKLSFAFNAPPFFFLVFHFILVLFFLKVHNYCKLILIHPLPLNPKKKGAIHPLYIYVAICVIRTTIAMDYIVRERRLYRYTSSTHLQTQRGEKKKKTQGSTRRCRTVNYCFFTWLQLQLISSLRRASNV